MMIYFLPDRKISLN